MSNEQSASKQSGLLVVVAAASGTGKSTVCRQLLKAHTGAVVSVSYTTRAPRTGEENGVHYHFVSVGTFKQMIADEALLEWAEVHGNFYGTGRHTTETQLQAGRDVLLDIDVQGARTVQHAFGHRVVLIFLLPPSWDEMVRRLRDRGTEDEAAIARRLQTAQTELPAASEFDYLVVNDDVEEAALTIVSILKATRSSKLQMQSHLTDILVSMGLSS